MEGRSGTDTPVAMPGGAALFRPWSCLFLAWLFLLPATYGQENGPVWAFVQNLKGKSALKASSGYKYETARQVFDRLARARGDFRQPLPAFTMNNGEQFVAWMSPQAGAIGLEEKAYDLCAAMGADSLNALAALLAHEMVHYFEKHDWTVHFAEQNSALSTADSLRGKAGSDRLSQETQADYLGGFLAYTAGYQVYDMMPRLLSDLYAGYGIPEVNKPYPSLSERVAISKNAMGRLGELQILFETAGLLTLTGQHADAATYYQEILRDFPSREIYNNAGTNLLLAAMAMFTPAEFPWVLPVELDPQSRLQGQKSGWSTGAAQRTELIREAMTHFERALLLDPAYSPAYLNLACCHLLSGDTEEAAYWVRKGKKLPELHSATAFRVVEGVIAAREGDLQGARTHWEEAGQAGSLFARQNLDGPQTANVAVDKPGLDRIDGIHLERYMDDPQIDVEINLGNGIFTYGKQLPHSRIFVHSADNHRRYGFFHVCEGPCTDKTRFGTGIGSSREEWQNTHGPGAALVAAGGSVYAHYPNQRLLFRLSDDHHVAAWINYRISSP